MGPRGLELPACPGWGPGQPGLGQHGESTLHGCVTSGQSGGLSRSGDSGTSQGLWRAAGAAESRPRRGSGWGEQGLCRAVLEPGQWTPGRPMCGGRDYSGTAAQRRLGQECLYLCQMDFIQWFACIFSINLTKVYISSLVAQRLKRLPPMRETWVQSLGRDDPLEKEMATHSSILAWRIPRMEEPGRLQSTGSHRVGHD